MTSLPPAPSATGAALPTWESLILSEQPPDAAWASIFRRLRDTALATTPSRLHRQTVVPDRLIAESAWDLWQAFPSHAPKVVDAIREFWSASAAGVGSAVLILDALSLRELPLIHAAAQKRGIIPTDVQVRGACVPTETESFAAALGLGGRSKLFNNQPPQTFIFGGPDVHTDVLEGPFADCIPRIASKPRLFLWHKWPDDPLIHVQSEQREGDAVVAAEIKRTLASDEFWAFLNAMRQGRRLLITGDHGYASASEFSSEVRDDASIRLFAGAFGAQRAIREDPARPWQRLHLPPPVLRFADSSGTWLVVIGQKKWKVRGGFPTLCHGGLSLLEAALPVIELPPLG